MSEGAPNLERILTKNEILELVRSGGFNEQVRQEVSRWRSWMEVIVNTERDRIALEVDMLEFYASAGMREEESENAMQVYYFARATPGCDDLADIILGLYPEHNTIITEDDILGTQESE